MMLKRGGVEQNPGPVRTGQIKMLLKRGGVEQNPGPVRTSGIATSRMNLVECRLNETFLSSQASGDAQNDDEEA